MFDSFLWQRVFAPVRTLRWRLHRWSSESDREFWDGQFAAPAHDPFSSSYPGRLTIRRFSDLAAPHLVGVRVAVDLGCGPGEITCELARRQPGTRFLGFDHSEVAIEQARAHASRLGISNVVFNQADLETFGPPADTGLVTMFDAFHHVLDPEAFIARISRVCDRFFLIEPAGTAFGAWNRRHDLDWLPATVFQLSHRLEFEFGLGPPRAESAPQMNRTGASGGSPTEHRYTPSDFERFFRGFSLDMRGTIAGLEQYGPDPARHSRLRDRFGDAAYQLVVAIEDAMYEEGLDLAAKHWAIYASHAPIADGSRRQIRRPPEKAATGGLLPAYGAQYSAYEGPDRARCGGVFDATLRVKNTGWRPWSSVDNPPVMVSYHWLDSRRCVVTHEGLRTALATTIESGQEKTVLLRIQAPGAPGPAILSIDLVHESVAWFSDHGVVPHQVPFTIEPLLS
jgi:SAM-dependent methyltransferase